jgi:hypothetical protein
MDTTGKERRRYTRCYFSNADNVKAILNISSENPEVVTKVLDLSEGGMSIAFKKKDHIIIKGNTLILKEFSGLPELNPFSNITAEIKWVLNSEQVDYIGIGCEFKGITDETRIRIRNFTNIHMLNIT